MTSEASAPSAVAPTKESDAGCGAEIRDLLCCAFKYDDKPHHLFSALRRLAERHEPDPSTRAEIVRLMDYAYEHKGRAARAAPPELAALVGDLVLASRDAGWSWKEGHASRGDDERRQEEIEAALLDAIGELVANLRDARVDLEVLSEEAGRIALEHSGRARVDLTSVAEFSAKHKE